MGDTGAKVLFKSVKKISSNGSECTSDHFPDGAAFGLLKEKGDQFFLINMPIAELKQSTTGAVDPSIQDEKSMKAIAYVAKFSEEQ